MDRVEFDKLWFTGNVRVIVDAKKAWMTVWKGRLGSVTKLWQIVRAAFALLLASLGIFIMTKLQFALSPTEIGFSWWGLVLFLLAVGIPFLMKNSAAQAVKNRIIRDPEFYDQAQEMELFVTEDYY